MDTFMHRWLEDRCTDRYGWVDNKYIYSKLLSYFVFCKHENMEVVRHTSLPPYIFS